MTIKITQAYAHVVVRINHSSLFAGRVKLALYSTDERTLMRRCYGVVVMVFTSKTGCPGFESAFLHFLIKKFFFGLGLGFGEGLYLYSNFFCLFSSLFSLYIG